MSKEIWKLIDLLYEYQKIECFYPLYYEEEENKIYFDSDTMIWAEQYLISKDFWFIKWLVENEKVKPLRKFIGWETDEDEPYIQFDLVDQYIAYLSIQDEPISFLISLLK